MQDLGASIYVVIYSISDNLEFVIISLHMKYMQTAVDAALKGGVGFLC